MSSSRTINKSQIIHNKYQIDKLIGVGGLGRVYKAIQLKTNKTIAIKFLNDHLTHNSEVLGTFHRELLLTSKLHHKNIVGFIDSHFDPPQCYIVSEFVDGWNGHQFTKKVGVVPPLVALAICVDLLQGVDYLHLHDIVHSDISVANIMIGRNGRVYLTDFGFSVDPTIESYLEQTFGTPGFYSPEHITRAKIIPSSDLYCVGLILWRLITGRTPISFSRDPKSVKQAMKKLPYRKLHIPDRRVHAALIKILRKSLSYRPMFRYRSAKHMSYDCYKIISSVGLSYPRAGILQFLIDQKLTQQRFALPHQSIYLD